MSNRSSSRGAVSGDFTHVARGRALEIPWSHPAVSELGETARLVYACLVDGRSETARATLRGVEVVWRNRYSARRAELLDREAFDDICFAVQELVDAGLVILRDANSILDVWVRKPWEGRPS